MEADKENAIITIEQDKSLPVMAEPHMRLIEMAVNGGADIIKLEKLMDLQERFEAGQAKKEFNAAMSKFQSLLPVIGKNGVVDYESAKGRTTYDYAKLEDIAHGIKPALKESGLSYRFTQSQNSGWITVTCIVTHSSGHFESSELTSNADSSGGKDGIKAIASTISYLRRYTLTGLLGIVVGGEDDEADLDPIAEPKANGEIVYLSNKEYKERERFWVKAVKSGKKDLQGIYDDLNSKGQYFTLEQTKLLAGKCNETT